MSEDETTETQVATQNLLTRLLAIWFNYRRWILILIISTALVSFISSLSIETRLALVQGLGSHHSLFILLITFSLLILSLLWSAGQRLDTWIFLMLNLRGHHPLWLDRLMWAFTQIGSGILGIFAAIILYLANVRRLAIDLILGILSLWLVVEIVKAMVERRRPFIVLEGARIVGWRERGMSFPSGHTAQSFFMATLLTQYIQASPSIYFPLYAMAVFVGFTRIYVGAHYPRDVIGGAILGSVWGILNGFLNIYLTTGRF